MANPRYPVGSAHTAKPGDRENPQLPPVSYAPAPEVNGANLHVDPERMRAAAQKIHGASETLKALRGRIKNLAGQRGKFYGTDETSTSFAKQYEPGSNGVVDAMNGLASGLIQVADAVRKQAKAYDDAEKAAEKATK